MICALIAVIALVSPGSAKVVSNYGCDGGYMNTCTCSG
jgi:hypothetical protein